MKFPAMRVGRNIPGMCKGPGEERGYFRIASRWLKKLIWKKARDEVGELSGARM